jgi:hypothetical protein
MLLLRKRRRNVRLVGKMGSTGIQLSGRCAPTIGDIDSAKGAPGDAPLPIGGVIGSITVGTPASGRHLGRDVSRPYR